MTSKVSVRAGAALLKQFGSVRGIASMPVSKTSSACRGFQMNWLSGFMGAALKQTCFARECADDD